MQSASKVSKSALAIVLLVAMISLPGFARDKYETIDATAYGTSTQLGRNVGVTLIIYEFSTPEDRQILVDAFQKGQNQGLVNALQKMKAVGRIQIPGTLGYDVSFIRLIPYANRPQNPLRHQPQDQLRRSLYATASRSQFDLTAGELDLNDQDKSKSSGVLYPACQFVDQQRRRVPDRTEPECLAVEQHYRLEGHGGKLAQKRCCGRGRTGQLLDCKSGCFSTSHCPRSGRSARIRRLHFTRRSRLNKLNYHFE